MITERIAGDFPTMWRELDEYLTRNTPTIDELLERRHQGPIYAHRPGATPPGEPFIDTISGLYAAVHPIRQKNPTPPRPQPTVEWSRHERQGRQQRRINARLSRTDIANAIGVTIQTVIHWEYATQPNTEAEYQELIRLKFWIEWAFTYADTIRDWTPSAPRALTP